MLLCYGTQLLCNVKMTTVVLVPYTVLLGWAIC